MDDYMVAIINGRSDDDGKLNYLGYNFCFSYYGECLLDYASLKYPHISGFSKLDYMKEPNSPIYYLSLLDNIIFTNISVDNEKRGVLYFPKHISDKQLETLYEFIDSILDYDVWFVYDMSMMDGMFVGVSFDFDKNINTRSKLDEYILQNEEVLGNGQKIRR